MISVIDYGAGNLKSVTNALDFLRAKYKVTDKAKDIKKADKIIFPGVGNFGDCIESLKKKKLFEILKEEIRKKPYLGICLGLQVLFEQSEESENVKGLSIFKGKCKKFKNDKLKVPQIGWNSIRIIKLLNPKDSKGLEMSEKQSFSEHTPKSKISDESKIFQNKNKLLKNIKNNSYFYFVHSYYVEPKDKSIILTKTNYGIEYCSGIAKDDIFAFQFHPERSGEIGLRILKNFVEL